MSWFGPGVHCVVISPNVDSKGENWNNSVEYRNWKETVGQMVTISQSITSNPVLRLFGNNAAHDIIMHTLLHFAGKKKWNSLATNHVVKEDDVVFVFYAAHGHATYRKGAESEFVVDRPIIKEDGRGIFSEIKTRLVTTEISSKYNVPLIYPYNPVKYNRGIVTFSSGISLDSDYPLLDLKAYDTFKPLTPAQCNNKRYIVRKPYHSQSKFSVTIFNIPDNDGLQGNVPTAEKAVKQTIEFPLYSYRIYDPDGTLVGQFDECVGHRGGLEDGKLTLYRKDEVADPDSNREWWSYLPPVGAYGITSEIQTRNYAGTESNGRPFTSIDLGTILNNAKTNMFFLFESCYSGGFARSYLMSDKSVRIHTASDANNVSWRAAGWTPNCAYVGGHLTNCMFEALFIEEGMGNTDKIKRRIRKSNVTWRTIMSIASRKLAKQNPYFANTGEVFDSSKTVPAEGQIEFVNESN